MLSFDNTEIAFADKTTPKLKKAYWLFWLVKSPWLVNLGGWLLTFANKVHLPLRWALKKTVFDHFCGGESLEDSQDTINSLGMKNIKSVLDYTAEGGKKEKEFDEATNRIIATIELGKTNRNIGFAVFKFSGIARFRLLEKASDENMLSEEELEEFARVKNRAERICSKAREMDIPLMIDAEESWVQETIDRLAEELMEKYNREKPIVFHTLQLYRIDKLFYLKKLATESKEKGFRAAFKLVRGAYMEKERQRANNFGYVSPIHPDKLSTDKAFNEAVRFCMEDIDQIAVCIGSHNEVSNLKAIQIMNEKEIIPDHPNVLFSQLKGMSDHISYNLANAGYHVSKYVPYGPLKMALPYLIRRAQENTSVAGQTGRELFLIKKELKRRKAKTKSAGKES